MSKVLLLNSSKVKLSQISEYKNTISRLLNNERSVGLAKEKIRDNLHSARINDAKRILYSIGKLQDGKECLLILDILENHEYDRSPFVKNHTYLNNALSDFSKHTNLEVDVANLDNENNSACANDDDHHTNNFDITEAHIMNDRFVICDNSQRDAITTSFGSVISGSPGSGKTSIALHLMIAALKKGTPNDKLNLFYITPTKALADESRDTLAAQLNDEGINAKIVDNRVYTPLGLCHFQNQDAQERCFFPGEKQVITQEQCIDFIRNNLQKRVNSTLSRVDIKDIYLSLTILNSLPGTSGQQLERFKTLGTRQRYYLDSNQIDILHSINQEILTWVEEQNGFHMGFNSLGPDTGLACDAIYVDEGQNFTIAELFNFYSIARGKVMFFMDTNQDIITRNEHGIRALFLHLFNIKYNTEFNHLKLEESHRSSQTVTKAANIILKLINNLFGASDQYDYKQMPIKESAPVGGVDLHTNLLSVNSNFINNRSLQTNKVIPVIVLDKNFKQNIKQHLKTPLVMTPGESHGLEYDEVAVYIDKDTHRVLQSYFDKKQPNVHGEVKYRATQSLENHDENIRNLLRHLVIANTRAKNKLTFIIDETAQHDYSLIGYLQEAFTNLEHNSPVKDDLTNLSIPMPETLKQEHKKEAIKQAKHGNLQVALDILTQTLSMGEADAKSLLKLDTQNRQATSTRNTITQQKEIITDAAAAASSSGNENDDNNINHHTDDAAAASSSTDYTASSSPTKLNNTQDEQESTYIPTTEDKNTKAYKSWEEKVKNLIETVKFADEKCGQEVTHVQKGVRPSSEFSQYLAVFAENLKRLFESAAQDRPGKDKKLLRLNYLLYKECSALKNHIVHTLLFFIGYLSDKHKQLLLNNINPLLLNSPLPCQYSFLYIMCSFIHNSTSYPSIINLISKDAFYREIQDPHSPKVSPFIDLCSNQNGRKFLLDNLSLLDAIDKHNFNKILTHEEKTFSTLMLLCLDKSGLDILSKKPILLARNFITKKHFCHIMEENIALGISKGTTALMQLCAHQVAHQILLTNSHLLSQDLMTPKALNSCVTNSHGKSSPLLYIIKANKLRPLLIENMHLLDNTYMSNLQEDYLQYAASLIVNYKPLTQKLLAANPENYSIIIRYISDILHVDENMPSESDEETRLLRSLKDLIPNRKLVKGEIDTSQRP